MKPYRIALIPGDGIGKEVVLAAAKVLQATAARARDDSRTAPEDKAQGFSGSFEEFDWGCEYYLRTGRMMPEEGLDRVRPFDAILPGAANFATENSERHLVRGVFVRIVLPQ